MIALVDFGAGNLRSVENALGRLGVDAQIATTAEAIADAAAVILPGVGAAAPAMAALRDRQLDQAIVRIIQRGTPFLGICLGLQLLFERSAEDGARCLGILPGTVERLATSEKLPHVGWNTVDQVRPHPVLRGLESEAMYFVHSYVVAPDDRSIIAANTTHGIPFVSAVAINRLVAVQFHPERSGPAGLRFLQNFLTLAGVQAPTPTLPRTAGEGEAVAPRPTLPRTREGDPGKLKAPSPTLPRTAGEGESVARTTGDGESATRGGRSKHVA
jgi:glutamine amidotransferase